MEERTEIADLGEFGLIDHLTKNIELQNASSILGVGDDAAVHGAVAAEMEAAKPGPPAQPTVLAGVHRVRDAQDVAAHRQVGAPAGRGVPFVGVVRGEQRRDLTQ